MYCNTYVATCSQQQMDFLAQPGRNRHGFGSNFFSFYFLVCILKQLLNEIIFLNF